MFICIAKQILRSNQNLHALALDYIISYGNRHSASYPDQKMRVNSIYFNHLNKSIQVSSDLQLGAIIPFNLRICFIYLSFTLIEIKMS
jgi:hypothetical protein